MLKNIFPEKFKKVKISRVIKDLQIKNPNILLIGNFGNGNLGDEILLRATTNDLLTVSKKINITVRDKQIVKTQDNKMEFVMPLSLRGLNAFFSSNTIIFGPGGIFGKDIGPFPKLIPILTIIAKTIGKKVIFYGFGIYEETPKYIQTLVKYGCYIADSVSVRDEHSYKLLSSSKLLKNKVQLILDPGFYILDQVKLAKTTTNTKLIKIGISLRYIENNNERDIFINSLANSLLELKNKVILVPLNFYSEPQNLVIKHAQPSDSKMIKLLNSKLKNKIKIGLNTENIKIEEMIKKYSSLDLVIAMRFHAQILAILFNLPLLTIGYSPKNEIAQYYKKGILTKETEFNQTLIKKIMQI